MESDTETRSEGKIGEYRIVRPLGRGGMGAVYEVASISNGKRCALKIFASVGKNSDFFKKRFIAEGKILACLNHPRLVKVHKLSIDEDTGMPFFTMDMILSEDGTSCNLEMYRKRKCLGESEIASIYSDLREALAYLHAQGIVHRDIKLENILMDADGRAVLSDFGVSRILRSELRDAISVTTTLASDRAPIIGSAGYLSAELKSGKPATPPDDAWALGVLVFRLLTGVWYEADSSAMDLIAGFSSGWDTLLKCLLNADPKKRIPLPQPPIVQDDEGVISDKANKKAGYLPVLIVFLIVLAIGAVIFAYVSKTPSLYSFEDFFPLEEEINIK